MLVYRSKYFSKDEKKDDFKTGAAMLAGGVGLASVGSGGSQALIEKFGEGLRNSEITASDSKKIKEAILKKAENQGIKVVKDDHFGNSAYMGSKAGRKVRDFFAKAIRKGRSKDANKLAEKLRDDVRRKTGRKVFDNLGKDVIILGNGSLADVDVISHEIGHAQFLRPGRSNNIVGKAAHKAYGMSNLATNLGSTGGSFAYGFHSGKKNERKKQEGKKLNTWDKIKSVAVPAAIAAPVLVAEAAASGKGLKMMKEAGASKELLKQSRKRLTMAGGTYASIAGKSVISGGAGELAGRGYAKLKGKKKKDDEDKKK